MAYGSPDEGKEYKQTIHTQKIQKNRIIKWFKISYVGVGKRSEYPPCNVKVWVSVEFFGR